MWTCTWMSFTYHTFTSLPLVHTSNPDFLRRCLWLCFLLIRESSHSGNHRAPWLPNSTSSRFLNFTDPRFRGFTGSWLRVFTSLLLRSFTGLRFQIFAHSRLRSFVGSRFQIFASSIFLKTYFTNFINLNVSRVTRFPEFPNTDCPLPLRGRSARPRQRHLCPVASSLGFHPHL
jgi:hypothetical protein